MRTTGFLSLCAGLSVLALSDFGFADSHCGPPDEPPPGNNCVRCAFRIEDASLVAGATGQEIPILMTNSIPVFGASVAFTFDPTQITVTGVEKEGTLSEGVGVNIENSFFHGGTEPGKAGYAIVRSFTGIGDPSGHFPATTQPDGQPIPGEPEEQVLLKLIVDVAAAATGTVELSFADGVEMPSISTPPWSNNMTNDCGGAIAAGEPPESPPPGQLALNSGTFTIVQPTPRIDSVAPPAGFPGDTITITGQFFDQGNLVVRVCNQEVPPTLVDAGTVTVAAPPCAVVGAVEVQLCTVKGCDSRPQGFEYRPPLTPNITALEPDSGPAGTEFLVRGGNFDQPGLAVQVCGMDAVHTPIDAASIRVTTPDCGLAEPTAVEVRVTTERGVATASFTFDPVVAFKFKRADANSDGRLDITDGIFVLNFLFLGGAAPSCQDAADANDTGGLDITDGIYIFNYLFLGGPEPEPPFDVPGTDPTPDTLPECQAPAAP